MHVLRPRDSILTTPHPLCDLLWLQLSEWVDGVMSGATTNGAKGSGGSGTANAGGGDEDSTASAAVDRSAKKEKAASLDSLKVTTNELTKNLQVRFSCLVSWHANEASSQCLHSPALCGPSCTDAMFLLPCEQQGTRAWIELSFVHCLHPALCCDAADWSCCCPSGRRG